MNLGKALAAGLLAATVASEASALTFGIFGNLSSTAEDKLVDLITGEGVHTVELDVDGLSGRLDGYDVLWILNGNPGAQPKAMLDNFSALSEFVMAGGVLVYHDRNVASAAAALPGAEDVEFFQDDSTAAVYIDVANETTLVTNGPGGLIESDPGSDKDRSLDGGTNSTSGFALAVSLPAGAHILSRANSTEIVEFTFEHGLGVVHYSTIPLDYYLDGGPGNPNFVSVYAPNVVAYAASLASVPEPAAVLIFGVGLLGLAAARRRR